MTLDILEEYGDRAPPGMTTPPFEESVADLLHPPGWQVESTYDTVLRLDLVAAGDDRHSTIHMGARHTNLRRGDETLEIEAVTLDPAAWPWVESILAEGGADVQELSDGRGFVQGTTAVAHRGATLLRATYDAGAGSEATGAAADVLGGLLAPPAP